MDSHWAMEKVRSSNKNILRCILGIRFPPTSGRRSTHKTTPAYMCDELGIVMRGFRTFIFFGEMELLLRFFYYYFTLEKPSREVDSFSCLVRVVTDVACILMRQNLAAFSLFPQNTSFRLVVNGRSERFSPLEKVFFLFRQFLPRLLCCSRRAERIGDVRWGLIVSISNM